MKELEIENITLDFKGTKNKCPKHFTTSCTAFINFIEPKWCEFFKMEINKNKFYCKHPNFK